MLIHSGDDGGIAGCANSAQVAEQVVVTFTGFGPANGAQFFSQSPAPNYRFGNEEQIEFTPPPPAVCFFGRTYSASVIIPTRRRVRCTSVELAGEEAFTYASNAILSVGGESVITRQVCQIDNVGIADCDFNVMSIHLFEPFFNLSVNPPWNLNVTRTNANPTGIVGTWLNTGENYSDGDSIVAFADSSLLQGSLTGSGRILFTASLIPGEDGQLNTADDRVLFVGGGDRYWGGLPGDQTTSNSAEVYLPPFANGL